MRRFATEDRFSRVTEAIKLDPPRTGEEIIAAVAAVATKSRGLSDLIEGRRLGVYRYIFTPGKPARQELLVESGAAQPIEAKSTYKDIQVVSGDVEDPNTRYVLDLSSTPGAVRAFAGQLVAALKVAPNRRGV